MLRPRSAWAERALLTALVVTGIYELWSLCGMDASHTDFVIYHATSAEVLQRRTLTYSMHTADTLSGWLYPPAAILLFLPFGALPLTAAYWLFVLSMFCCAAACSIWLVQIARLHGYLESRRAAALVIAFWLVNGVSFYNFAAGQVNFAVLFFCLLFFQFAKSRRNIGAAGLACGVLLKLYPALMIVMGIASSKYRLALLRAIVWALAIVGVSLLAIPLESYYDYILNFLPAISGKTLLLPQNQSLSALLLRFTASTGAPVATSYAVAIPHWIAITNTLFILVLLGAAAFALKAFKESGEILAFAILLATTAMASPLGWGHTYALSLPLWALCAAQWQQLTWAIRSVFVLSTGAIFVPAYTQLPGFLQLRWLTPFFEARLLLATVCFVVIALLIYRDQTRSCITSRMPAVSE